MPKGSKIGTEGFDKVWLDGLVEQGRIIDAAQHCAGKITFFADYLKDVGYDETPIDIFIQKTDTFQKSVYFLNDLVKKNLGLNDNFNVPEYLNVEIFRDIEFPEPDPEKLTHAKIDVAITAFQVTRDSFQPRHIKTARETFENAVNTGLELDPSTLFKGGLAFYFDAQIFMKLNDPVKAFDAGTKAYFTLMYAGDATFNMEWRASARDAFWYANEIVDIAKLPSYAGDYAKHKVKQTLKGILKPNAILAMDTENLGPFDREFLSYLSKKQFSGPNGQQTPETYMLGIQELLAKKPLSFSPPRNTSNPAIIVISTEKPATVMDSIKNPPGGLVSEIVQKAAAVEEVIKAEKDKPKGK